MPNSPEDVTRLLEAVRAGEQGALDRLLPLVYDELHRIAARYARRERTGHTLQPTALVNEAYLRLADHADKAWQNRAHFLAVAAQTMRHILVDYARARQAGKRGGALARVTLEEAVAAAPERDVDLLALDDALARLSSLDPQLARLVELRYFGGLTIRETAEVLNVSPKTVEREWDSAKLWLRREISGDDPP
jgi:RNA polymerase sigma-70 factor, ECF subfamily